MATRPELRTALATVPGVRLREEEPVARHGALRLGGGVELYVVVHDEAALEAVAAALRGARVSPRLFHPLSDAFARDAGLAGALLRLGPAFAEVEAGGEGIDAGVGAPLAAIGAAAERAGFEEWSGLCAWPGTLGSWCAGLDPEALARLFVRVTILTGRGVRRVDGAAVASIPRSAELLGGRLPRAPVAALPPSPPWPGALFDQDSDVASALARSSLPGVRLRRVRLATEQVGVVVNLGGGTARDLELLCRLAQERLGRDHGLEVQSRLQPLGRPPSPGNPFAEEET